MILLYRGVLYVCGSDSVPNCVLLEDRCHAISPSYFQGKEMNWLLPLSTFPSPPTTHFSIGTWLPLLSYLLEFLHMDYLGDKKQWAKSLLESSAFP